MILTTPKIKKETAQKVQAFFQKFPRTDYKTGEFIYRSEQTLSTVYFLKKGHAKQLLLTEEGKELTLHIFNPGSFFPLIWAILDLPNKFTCQTLTYCEIYKAPKDDFLKFIKAEPEVLYDLTYRLLSAITGLSLRIENLTFGDAHRKTASTLLYLARHFAERKQNQAVFKVRFTHSEISDLAGMARETASKELEKMQKKKLILTQDRFITIPDLKKLESYVQTKGKKC